MDALIRRKLIEENLIAAMLTLPSNMFYTVTLPATLWFFDRAKPGDRILFIDARNVFTQIDRAHHEFSDEQIANLAVINALRHGHRERFVRLVDRYFAAGMQRLRETRRRSSRCRRSSTSAMYFMPRERRSGNIGPKFRNGDVLFPRITPSVENGKRGLVMTLAEGEVAHGSTEFIVFREKRLSSEHIYFLSCSEGFRTNAELSMTGASGRQRVQERCFSAFLGKVPPDALRQRLVDTVRPMVSQIRVLAQQNENLTRTRDLLLPRLISGKLRVDEPDIQFPPSMTVARTEAAGAGRSQ